jgi:hypothetical protein
MICEFLGSRPIFTTLPMQDDHDTIFNPTNLNPKKPTNNNGLTKKNINLTIENFPRLWELNFNKLLWVHIFHTTSSLI